jgi:hypothetical protein
MNDSSNEILSTLKSILECLQRQDKMIDFIAGFEERMLKRQRDVIQMNQRLSESMRRT